MADARPFDPESILRVLAQRDVAYVLIGGLAASLRGSPHVTTDVDITVHGTRVVVAALADVIRSKAAAGREKDRLTLPTLRRLLERLESED